MNTSQFMDKQIMDLSSSKDFSDLINDSQRLIGRDNEIDSSQKEEILPSYDFQPIRPAGSANSSASRVFTLSDSKPLSASPTRSYGSLNSLEPGNFVLEKDQSASNTTILSEIDRTMKKHADNLVHVMEGLSARLTQLETRTRDLENLVDDLKVSVGNSHGSIDGKMRQLENILLEVQSGVQLLKDKQEIVEAQLQLSKFQISKEDQQPETQTTASAPQPHMPQAEPVAQPPASASHAHMPQLPAPASASHSHMPQVPAPFPRPPASVTPPTPPQQSLSQPPQFAPPQEPYYPPPPGQAQTQPPPYQIPPPNQLLQQPHQPPYQSPPQQPQFPQQSPPQLQPPSSGYLPDKPSFPPQSYPVNPPRQQYYSSPPQPPPMYDGPGGGRSGAEPYPYTGSVSPRFGSSSSSGLLHMSGGGSGYPQVPTARPLPHALPTASAVSSGSSGSPRAGSRVPVDDVVDKVTSMGFSREQVRATVRRLTENGQAVDLNVVLDKLMNEGGGGGGRGWFGGQ